MYTVSKGPSKIVAKTRRGITQNVETLRDLTRKPDPEENHEAIRHVPRPVFHINGKSKLTSQRHQRPEIRTPQHEELIKFVYDAWSQVNIHQGGDASDGSECSEPSPDPGAIVYYDDGEPNGVLQDFKPFDLESWWGKRLFNNITKSL